MTINPKSPLERALATVHPRRAIAAIAASLGSVVLLRTTNLDADPEVLARRRQRDPEVQGPCSDDPKKNKCRRNRECCTGFCDPDLNRCRYKRAGESCTSDLQCRDSAPCVNNICTRGQTTVTPSTSPSPAPSNTPT